MLTTTHLGLKKPQTTDARSSLRTAISDNADAVESALFAPFAQVSRVASQSIPTGAGPTAITFDTEVNDTNDAMIAIGTQPTRVTFTTGGIWLLSAYVVLPNVTEIQLRAGGATLLSRRKWAASASGGEDTLQALALLANGSYAELLVAHSNGASQNATAQVSAVRVAALTP